RPGEEGEQDVARPDSEEDVPPRLPTDDFQAQHPAVELLGPAEVVHVDAGLDDRHDLIHRAASRRGTATFAPRPSRIDYADTRPAGARGVNRVNCLQGMAGHW